MPNYTYEHPISGKQIDIIQTMSEEHRYHQDGIEWKRVFIAPSAKVDSIENCNPFDSKDFVKRTARKGMTMGDMWDESSRLSNKRAKVCGKDPLKEKAMAEYKKKTTKDHPNA